MKSPGLTVRPDLNEEQLVQLIRLIDRDKRGTRNWDWALRWLTGQTDGNYFLNFDQFMAEYEDDSAWL